MPLFISNNFEAGPWKILSLLVLVAEWIHFTLFWDNITHYKTESVYFLGLINSATKWFSLLVLLDYQYYYPCSGSYYLPFVVCVVFLLFFWGGGVGARSRVQDLCRVWGLGWLLAYQLLPGIYFRIFLCLYIRVLGLGFRVYSPSNPSSKLEAEAEAGDRCVGSPGGSFVLSGGRRCFIRAPWPERRSGKTGGCWRI